MCLGGLEHSTLQGGKLERGASQEEGCHRGPERTFHSARCSMEDIAGMKSLWGKSVFTMMLLNKA